MVHPIWIMLPGLVLGVAGQLQQPVLWPDSGYGAMLLSGFVVAGLAFWGHSTGRVLRGTLLAGLVAGMLVGAGWTGLRAARYQSLALSPALEGVEIAVSGTVTSLPQRGSDSDRFLFAVEAATLDGQAVRVPELLLLSDFHGAAPGKDWRAGDAWRLVVRLRRPHGLSNPHGFDRERWLWEQSIGATGTLRHGPGAMAPVRLGRPGWQPIATARQWAGERIAQQVTDPRSAGVLAALVVGEQSAIDHHDWVLFRETGVAHLMSISGLHVTMFAWLATAGIAVAWRRVALHWPRAVLFLPVPLAAGWGGVLAAGAYALFAGWGIPAQRTVLMLAMVVGLRLSARRWPWPMVWTLAMVAVLMLDPWSLLQPGFWLSFVAVGILFAAGDPADSRPRSDDRVATGWRRGWRAFLALVREQGVVTVALAPLGLVLFGQVSLAGLAANLLAIPWVTLVVTPLAMLGVLVAPLWELASLAVQVLVALLDWLGQWDWAAVYRPIPPWPLAALGTLGGVWLVLRLPMVLRMAGLVLMAPMLLWSPARPLRGEFEVMAIDVGQGSALLVRTADHSLLYDTGPRYGADSDAGDRVVVPLLRALGESPDTVVVSHRDSDHSGGAASVRAAWPQAQWLASYGESERCVAGQRWEWDGVAFEMLHPAPEQYGPDGEGRLSTNAMSCVLHIGNGRRAAWLSGDLDAERETRLAMAQPQLRADLMVAPHHGSASSSSPVLLNTLQPTVVLIQSGYRNQFHHPAAVVMDRYRARHIHWENSPQCGAAIWRSDASSEVVCERAVSRRYWHHPGADSQSEGLSPEAEP